MADDAEPANHFAVHDRGVSTGRSSSKRWKWLHGVARGPSPAGVISICGGVAGDDSVQIAASFQARSSGVNLRDPRGRVPRRIPEHPRPRIAIRRGSAAKLRRLQLRQALSDIRSWTDSAIAAPTPPFRFQGHSGPVVQAGPSTGRRGSAETNRIRTALRGLRADCAVVPCPVTTFGTSRQRVLHVRGMPRSQSTKSRELALQRAAGGSAAADRGPDRG